ncbi:hypothetical protein D0863_05370 [Hortaea werneckii]|uniref:SMP-30/Gluconolactonase/LRE-like region domain-containing protein n=1 Tax=Hortaea werneckii TaxID=91943 RepID=A0A3M7E304_HORWE|nr:hypothetical protein D0863_05370 [Hortaea werneckii]
MPEVKKYTIAEPYLNLQGGLLEAPFWEQGRDSLRFVDIVKKKLYFLNPKEGPSSLQTWDLDFNIGTTADIEGTEKEFVFGGKYGYGIMNRETGESRWIRKFWNDEERKPDGGGKPGKGETREIRMRSNDGAVDAAGRFFVGAMNDPVVTETFTDEGPYSLSFFLPYFALRPPTLFLQTHYIPIRFECGLNSNLSRPGLLFRLDPDGSLHRVKEQITIPNGISWTSDNQTIYFTNSPTQKITKYPYDLSTGSIDWEQGTTFFQCPYEGGFPDGHAQDEEGCFWIALFGTGKVVRVNPQGEMIAQIEFPTRCVTCPAFVGTELFVTSAAEEEPEHYPWSTKCQGSLYRIDVGVRGAPRNRYRNQSGA